MKKLLDKTLAIFSLYALVVLAASIPAYYFLVDSIWLQELDENNRIVAEKTAFAINKLQLNDTALAQTIRLWNKIQPQTALRPLAGNHVPPDSTYTKLKQKAYRQLESIDRFRGLVTAIRINGKPYQLTVETNVEETEETVLAIAALTVVFFLMLVIGFLLINKRMSVNLWRPFRDTLAKLKAFNLDRHRHIRFEKSDTLEFEELNAALQALLEQNVMVYQTQKEFTENASHEMQTPLAIVKSKLDLLLQEETLNTRQYELAEDIGKAVTRLSRINKNLLLLAKIENGLFINTETLAVSHLVRQCIVLMQEHAGVKGINIKTTIAPDVVKKGNEWLTETLLNNLLLNAIRHSPEKEEITIALDSDKLCIANAGRQALNSRCLFQRFAKVSNDSTGTGLGLAIIREVCRMHQWQVSYHYQSNRHHFTIAF